MTRNTPASGGRSWGCPVPIPTSVAALSTWVTERLDLFRSGALVPVDPGPMAAPHAHAHPH